MAWLLYNSTLSKNKSNSRCCIQLCQVEQWPAVFRHLPPNVVIKLTAQGKSRLNPALVINCGLSKMSTVSSQGYLILVGNGSICNEHASPKSIIYSTTIIYYNILKFIFKIDFLLTLKLILKNTKYAKLMNIPNN